VVAQRRLRECLPGNIDNKVSYSLFGINNTRFANITGVEDVVRNIISFIVRSSAVFEWTMQGRLHLCYRRELDRDPWCSETRADRELQSTREPKC
jgi:hypothetical protein